MAHFSLVSKRTNRSALPAGVKLSHQISAKTTSNTKELDMEFQIKIVIGRMFSGILLFISLLLSLFAFYQVYEGLQNQKELMTIFVHAINTIIISLAIFELGIGVGKEYAVHEDDQNIFTTIRRTITRFVGTVSIALVLESLIMIIKYSQLELAGNLYYPVAILAGAGALLTGMGVFLHLSREDCEDRDILKVNKKILELDREQRHGFATERDGVSSGQAQ